MVDYSKKCKKIVDELIRKSFPDLKGKKIVIFELAYRKFTASVLDFSFIKLIFIDPKKVELYSYSELKGLFAHELCHFERHANRSFFEKISFIFRYLSNKKVRIEEEKETDKLIIRKGYAKCLYALIKHFEKTSTKEYLKSRMAKGYLSSKQIKQYAIKVGKW